MMAAEVCDFADMTCKEAFKYLPARIINLVNKLIGIKGVVLFTTYCLFKQELIPESAVGYVWIGVVLIVVFGEKALTVFKDIKK